MDPTKLRVFYLQVDTQCRFAMKAFEELEEATTTDCFTIFYRLQAFLTAAANISKLLWSQSEKGVAYEERQELRDGLCLSVNSLKAAKDVRNRFDHLDEDIDEWWEQSSSRNFVDMNLGPRSAIQSQSSQDYFRNYDPATAILNAFDDKTINVREIYTAILSIHDAPKQKEKDAEALQIAEIERRREAYQQAKPPSS